MVGSEHSGAAVASHAREAAHRAIVSCVNRVGFFFVTAGNAFMHFDVRAAGAAGTVSCGTPGLGTRPDYPLNPAVFSYAQPDRGIYVSLSTAQLGGTPPITL
ncbi:hypothetical protein RR46_12263 [Papilio xuthus]|uniref:Uncharacterized protein n=1 Tax=Papilio xuthus TaxID=66420 RepID=A0A194PR85_PAPXU|nr:hypothetical protein RR46_12263 [Papilio xuthus]